MLVIGVFSTNVGGHRPKFWYLVENRANKVSALDSGSCGGKESASGGAPGVSTKILPFIERIHFPKIGPICGYIFDNQRIGDTEVIDILHGGGGGLADGSVLIGGGGAGDEGDGGGEGDADEIGIDDGTGEEREVARERIRKLLSVSAECWKTQHYWVRRSIRMCSKTDASEGRVGTLRPLLSTPHTRFPGFADFLT